jgi:molecular chaperone DnaK (HSP70)
MAKAVGIDLGTTNSVVAVMEGGKPVVIINGGGGKGMMGEAHRDCVLLVGARPVEDVRDAIQS